MQKSKSQFKIQNLLIILIVSFIFVPTVVFGAVLYLEPEEGQYYIEDVFVAEIRLDTEGQDINTIKVDLTFPQELLEVKDFSKGDSILVFWPEGPNFSNQTGRIYFVGGMPGGYLGEDGLLGKIAFGAKKEGEALVQIEDNSQVLLNDGLGTLVELTTKEGLFTIFPEKQEIPEDEWKKELEKDDISPEPFEIIVSQDPFLFDGKYFIVFSAIDKQTGIDYYEVKEGKKDWKRGESPYLLEDQSLQSKILVKAVDKSGNGRIAEYLPPEKPFPYWIVIVILVGAGVIYWVIRKLKVKK